MIDHVLSKQIELIIDIKSLYERPAFFFQPKNPTCLNDVILHARRVKSVVGMYPMNDFDRETYKRANRVIKGIKEIPFKIDYLS